MFGSMSRRMTVQIGVFVLVLLVLPVFVRDAYFLHVLILSLLFATFASAWHLVTGFAGLKTFGHQAFFGVGAYASALLCKNYGLSPWLMMWVAGLAAALAGLVIAMPVLRIRSMPHVAIVTLGFGEIVRSVLSIWKDVTRGELGLWGIPTYEGFSLPLVGEVVFNAANKIPYYYLILGLFLLAGAVILGLMRSRHGLAIIAMRESQNAAESLGIDLVRYKLAVFIISAFIVGVCGAFYAHYLVLLTPTSVAGMDLVIVIVAMTLVGGIGTFYGPIVGAFVLTLGVESMRELGQYRMLIYGGLVIAAVMFFPRGLAPLVERIGGGFGGGVRSKPVPVADPAP
jgi:branched-chain amino acid transport system permease protein